MMRLNWARYSDHPRLAVVQEFSRGEVFKVLVIGDNIDGCCGKVVMPDPESFIDSK